jgi:Ni,Fe-hydrogenase I large subunit
VGWAETARGLVVHRVRLNGDRVAGYRIVAPTEWNFHPEGAFAQGARRIEGEARAIEAKVQRLVASLDPCVGVRYEARHA